MDPEIAAGRDSINNIPLSDRICCCPFGSNQVMPHDGMNKNWDSSLELTWGSWISEHGLWTSAWQHTGNLSGTTDSQIFVIKGEDFGRVVQQDLPIFCDVVIYARYFVHEMNQTAINTDLPPDQVVRPSKSKDAAALQDSMAFHDLLTTAAAGS
ncbi:Pol [Symbiodinium pilosum]|uniref:Pol protein n=1 Tax=Symbiodinium pilosum TaxID=2952 RepID=A0A812YLV6_SYMPI|nr:Pol [Symbiodinium pilosum]